MSLGRFSQDSKRITELSGYVADGCENHGHCERMAGIGSARNHAAGVGNDNGSIAPSQGLVSDWNDRGELMFADRLATLHRHRIAGPT